jgi:hypothetical protein
MLKYISYLKLLLYLATSAMCLPSKTQVRMEELKDLKQFEAVSYFSDI